MRKLIQFALVAAMAAPALTGCTIYLPPDDDQDDPSWPPPYPEPLPPYPEPLPPPPPPPPPPDEGAWIAFEFETYGTSECAGERFVRYSPAYDRWVGAILCGSAERYKLYLGSRMDDLYFEVADYAGHGQDHCELVNPKFSLPNEDDITSGGCTDCAVGDLVDLVGVPVYARAYLGEPFRLTTSQDWGDLTTTWYECGVSISAGGGEPGDPDDPTDPTDPPKPPPSSGFTWTAADFKSHDGVSYCDGKRYIRFSEEYQLWVGAEVCEVGQYKLFLSDVEDGIYLEIADYAGHGQDHCELANASFTMPDDDITSGGCTDCAIGELIDPIDIPVYARANYGEPFELVTSRYWGDLSTTWYRCGATIE